MAHGERVQRQPDTAIASGLKAGTVGILAVKLGEALAEAWVVPAVAWVLRGASEARIEEIAGMLPVVAGGASLALVSGAGTALRDYAAARGGALATFVGRFIAP